MRRDESTTGTRKCIRAFCIAGLALATLPLPGSAGDGGALSAEQAVTLALAGSPAVDAARGRLLAASAGERGARSPANLTAELAPGSGFTNGNALLSQPIDIGGRRRAQVASAVGLRAAAEAGLRLAALDAAAEARASYFALVRARAAAGLAEEIAGLARQIHESVRRRVEIGEAPAVQETGAAIEAARAAQDAARARAEAERTRAALNLLIGRPSGAPVTPTDALQLPDEPDPTPALLETALRERPEASEATALVEARRGELAVARAQRRPELFAEVAADAWSLDRDPFRFRDFGVQARLSFPLFDRGRLAAEIDRARAGLREQEAERQGTLRAVRREVEQSAAELRTARAVALEYERAIVPRTRELLEATQRGFAAGLSTFLEVLEAQRTSRSVRTESLDALYAAVRARIALDRAVGVVPGLPPRNGRNGR